MQGFDVGFDVTTGMTTGACVVGGGAMVVGIGALTEVQEEVVGLYVRPWGHWMMYIRPSKSHWMNFVASLGWG